MHSRSPGYDHNLRHELKLEHKHKPPYNPYGMLATKLADSTLVEAISDLDVACRRVRLADLLFPGGFGGGEKGKSQDSGNGEAGCENSSRWGEGAAEEIPEPGEPGEDDEGMGELLDVLQVVSRGIAQKTLRVDPALARAYAACIYNPVALRGKAGKATTDEPGKGFGRLRLAPEELCRRLGLSIAAIEELREAVAGGCIPVGLGFCSVYEYRYWLGKYMLAPARLPFPEVDLAAFASYRLRESAFRELGEDAPVVLQALSDLLRIQWEAFRLHGTRGKAPRSRGRLMKALGIDERQAQVLMELYRRLPISPKMDVVPESRGNRGKRPVFPELVLTLVPERRIEVTWNERLSRIRERLFHENTERIVRDIEVCSRMRFTDELELEEEIQDLKEAAGSKQQEEALDMASKFLLAHGELDLVREHLTIERGTDFKREEEGAQKVSPLIRAKIRQKTLGNIARHYWQIREAFELKPRIVEYVATLQMDYLLTSDIERLRPLRKLDVVEALGYLPSGAEVRDSEDRQRRNVGRRIERYIGKLHVVFPDGKVHPLAALVPGNGGVVDYAGEHVLDVVIQHYIRQLIDAENKRKPYSDQKLGHLLGERYAIPVSRSLVKKYRIEMGLKSSQERRTDGRSVCQR